MGDIVLMADLTSASLARLTPAQLAGVPKLGGYVTGSGGVQWTPAQLAAARVSHGLVTLDQSLGLAEFAAGRADGADCERDQNGVWVAGSPAAYAAALKVRIAGGHGFGDLYANDPDMTLIAQAVTAAGFTPAQMAEVSAWWADWNLNLAEASALIGTQVHGFTRRAVQWASPSSNPRTLFPGTQLTLAQVNADLSAADAAWHPAPGSPPAMTAGIVVYPGGATGLLASPVSSDDGGVTWRWTWRR